MLFTTACALLLSGGMPALAQSLPAISADPAISSAAPTVDYLYVSPQGSDSWSGQSPAAVDGSGPFQTLAHAQEALTALASPALTHPVEILLDPAVCAPQDFLTRWFRTAPRSPVIWHADAGRTVLIYTPTLQQQNEALASEDDANASAGPTTRFYVSAAGNDSWHGHSPVEDGEDGPFRSAAQAQEAVTAFLADSPGQAVEVVFEDEGGCLRTALARTTVVSPVGGGSGARIAAEKAHLTVTVGIQQVTPGGKTGLFGHSGTSSKLVFAHYMVCNRDYGGSVAGYERDIQEAQANGIDGFALNCGSWNSADYKWDTASIFKAARAVSPDGSFKLFFSADMTGLSNAEILQMMTAYSSHTNYWHIQQNGASRPVLSTWGGEGGTFADTKTRWATQVLAPLHAAGINPYFMPFFFTKSADGSQYVDLTPSNITAEINGVLRGLANGMFYTPSVLCPVSTTRNVFAGSETYAAALKSAGMGTMGSVTPQYWGSKQTTLGRRYIEYFGGEGLAAQWNSLINVQKPSWVECFTWNDFDEASYFSPVDDVSTYWPWLTHNRPGFYKCHSGAAKLNAYYIDWYKSGHQPVPTHDSLYCFYRTHPKDATATNDTVGRVSWFIGDCEDTTFVTTILTAPATLVVTSGSRTSTFSVPAGLTNTRIPFNVGAQSFKVVRSGRTLLTHTGTPIVAAPVEYDFNYYTASVSD